MARGSSQEASSVSLFPFLSILACIIGALTLLIAALSMSQLSGGRDPKDVARAERYLQLRKSFQQEQQTHRELLQAIQDARNRLEALAQPVEDMRRLEQQLNKLPQPGSPVNLNALVQERETKTENLAALEQRVERGQQRVAGLKQELAGRKAPERGPTVMVQPSRSGGSSRTYSFLELGGTNSTVYAEGGEKTLPSRGLIKNPKLAQAIEDCKKREQTLVILVREDGALYVNALEKHLKGLGVRYGKLPIVGLGDIDLSLFSL